MPPLGFEPKIPACERPLSQTTQYGMTVQLAIKVKNAAENGHVPVAGSTLTFTLKTAEKKSIHLSQGSLSRAEIEHETLRI
jgi:hypothetical protein